MARGTKRVGASGRTRADWEALVAKYERSGLSRKRFCDQASISVSSLDYWRHRLRSELRKEAASFIELPAVAASPAWDVELELGGGAVLELFGQRRAIAVDQRAVLVLRLRRG